MKKKLSILLMLMLGLSFNLFSQTQPTRPDPTKTNQENIVKKVLSFECPSTVQIGFKNANPGWTEGMGGGGGMTAPFHSAFVGGTPSVLTCLYKPAGENVVTFTLVQQAPTGYRCSVQNWHGKERLDRTIICEPISTPPKIIPKNN